MKTVTARRMALSSLLAFSKNGKYSNIEVDTALKRDGGELSEADRGLYTRLVYGVVERQRTLDFVIGKYSSRPISEIDVETLCILRLGMYQLIYLDRVPEFAAVSETVDLCPHRTKGFVNGVLRSFLRTGKNVYSDEQSRGVKYSVSDGILSVLTDSYGVETAERILSGLAGDRGVSLRINTLKVTVGEALGMLPDGEASSLCPDIIKVPFLDGIARDGIEKGLWFVQDEASRLATVVLGCRPGDIVADVCAAPGGKSFSCGIDMKNTGKLHSFDLHNNKISLIKSGAGRLGLSLLKAECMDAGNPDGALAGICDRVICDAPCSGLGVMGKKPEIRYKGAEEIMRLPKIQLRALTGASEYVKCGGTLVYSTCTLNKAENEGVVDTFLAESPEFERVDFTAGGLASVGGMLTIMPYITGSDGFFVSKMRRK